jgi:hypothetical protein
MRRLAIVLLLLTPLAPAQVLLSPAELAGARHDFEPRAREQTLRCDVIPLHPGITFAFRFEAGYVFQIPRSQYSGFSGAWSVLTAITPENGDPTYLLARHDLSDISRVDSNFEIRGVYYLGVGRYSVESSVRDGRNRVCRKQWRVVVAPSYANRLVPMMLPPAAVRQFSPVVTPDTRHQDSTGPRRLSVLLNAAAFSTRRTVIHPFDRAVLLGALTALIEHLPVTSLRLVVFSLEQQREVFRAENFQPPDLDKVAVAISSLDQATVDIHVLKKPLGHVDFLAALIRRECDAPDPADDTIVLGPTSRYGTRIPDGALPPAEGTPRFFYIRYETPRRIVPGNSPPLGGRSRSGSRASGGRGGPAPASTQPSESGDGLPDVITAAMRLLKGKTMTVQTPADLAKAIRRIEGRR